MKKILFCCSIFCILVFNSSICANAQSFVINAFFDAGSTQTLFAECTYASIPLSNSDVLYINTLSGDIAVVITGLATQTTSKGITYCTVVGLGYWYPLGAVNGLTAQMTTRFTKYANGGATCTVVVQPYSFTTGLVQSSLPPYYINPTINPPSAIPSIEKTAYLSILTATTTTPALSKVGVNAEKPILSTKCLHPITSVQTSILQKVLHKKSK